MVQSVGSLADSFTLFQSGGVARAASGSGQSTGGIASFGANQSGNSSDASTTSIASILDNSSQAQTTSSGDFANVFQRLSSGLQSLMVQLQSMAGTSASSSTAAAASSTTDVSAASTATTDATATDTAATDVAATVASDTAAKVDVTHHASGGNRALQGDIDAMINDLHGFIQVASGDASATADTTTASPTTGGAGAAGDSPPATGGPASSDGNASASQSAASSAADTAALNETTYGYAQNLMQALQNYSVASANVSNPQSSAISAVG